MNIHLKSKFVLMSLLIFLCGLTAANAQEWKWFRIGQLQSFYDGRGAEHEGIGYDVNTNFFSWPAQYGLEHTTLRQKGLWIGAKNFYDPFAEKEYSTKVIGVGPRDATARIDMIFEQGIKLVGRSEHPIVIVDDLIANDLNLYDEVDEFDENLPSDRMIEIKFNTSMGISVTKRIYAYSQQNHDDYFIHEYILKNTGIYNEAGDVYEQDIEDLYMYNVYRFAFAGESSGGFEAGWGAFSSAWGRSTLNYSFGQDPTASDFEMRAFYSWYGPNDDRTTVNYEEDWGCPNETDDGVLGSANFAGAVTLHADRSVNDRSDNLNQPSTTWYISSDSDIMSANVSQYDELFMQKRYDVMSEGHPDKTHQELIAEYGQYPTDVTGTPRNDGGGTSQGMGYGPYDIPFGDSIRVVFAEGINGISREKNREVGGKWLHYFNGTGTPELVMPDGSVTTDHNAYKKAWVHTGADSIKKSFRAALMAFENDFNIPEPPPPPSEFTVSSGGDRITLSWAENADRWPNFDGYVVYRSKTTVSNPESVYEKIFECNASNVVHTFDDTTARRGENYYYYVQAKDDGSTNVIEPGVPLMSSLFWTLTNQPAFLRRPPGRKIEDVRVVPNPYDVRAAEAGLQFGDGETHADRIAFYELPPNCKVKIFTERGDLIWETDHTDGSGDELWDSLTSSGQIVVSGVYILYVETTKDYDDLDTGENLHRKGETVFRKFVIIR